MSDDATKKGPDMRDEYDFSGGVRGKYFKRFRDGSNIVVLAPDVAADFPDSQSVNEALRGVQSERRKRPAAEAQRTIPKQR
ncbi:hypothetical protein BH23CHL7_BH23CHL7_15870 [soil metagenome]